MNVDLDSEDIKVIQDAIKYTLERVQNESGINYDARQQMLTGLEVVQNKLRHVEARTSPPTLN
jgi:hypothetical protein